MDGWSRRSFPFKVVQGTSGNIQQPTRKLTWKMEHEDVFFKLNMLIFHPLMLIFQGVHKKPCSEGVLPGKLTCPLKINGWKMYFLLKWSLFRGHSLVFRGVIFRETPNFGELRWFESEVWQLTNIGLARGSLHRKPAGENMGKIGTERGTWPIWRTKRGPTEQQKPTDLLRGNFVVFFGGLGLIYVVETVESKIFWNGNSIRLIYKFSLSGWTWHNLLILAFIMESPVSFIPITFDSQGFFGVFFLVGARTLL